MKKTKKMLIVVDPQNDFINGSLPVSCAVVAMDKLAAFLKEHKGEFDVIVITADWHTFTHCSFTENGGEWPVHCVQFSHGAAIYQPILDALQDVDYHILTKGLDDDHEEYSIWKNAKSNEQLHKLIDSFDINDVTIAGLAGDICVFNSLKDSLKELPNANFHFLKEFSPCIGDGKDVEEFVANSERVEF